MPKAKIAPTPAAEPKKSVPELAAALINKAPALTLADVTIPDKKTASRAGWTGKVTFGGQVTFPAKSYKATDTETISFNQLHSTCGCRLKQGAMYCPTCNASVDKDSITKGFEYSKDEYVTITPEELKGLQVVGDDELEITEFVPANQVDDIYLESSEYLAPDKGGERLFSLLRAGMVTRNVVGIGKRVARGREQTLVVRPYGKAGMVISYMYFEHEVRSFDKWIDVPLSDAEVDIAGQLVDALTESFKPATKFDTYTANVRKLVESKVPGSGVAAPQINKQAAAVVTIDLMAALTASLNLAKAKKAAKAA